MPQLFLGGIVSVFIRLMFLTVTMPTMFRNSLAQYSLFAYTDLKWFQGFANDYSQIVRRQGVLACCNQLVTCIYLGDRRLGALGQGSGNWDNTVYTVCTVHLQDYVIYLQWRITFTVRYSAVSCTTRRWYSAACCTLKNYYSREKWFFGELRWQMEVPVIG
jgi:hypothetical protein